LIEYEPALCVTFVLVHQVSVRSDYQITVLWFSILTYFASAYKILSQLDHPQRSYEGHVTSIFQDRGWSHRSISGFRWWRHSFKKIKIMRMCYI